LNTVQSLGLQVEVAYSDDDEVLPLPGSVTPDITVAPVIVYTPGQCVWAINGGLTDQDYEQFTTDQGRMAITYKAPAQVLSKGNPVTVSV
jgi:hypothetical protein